MRPVELNRRISRGVSVRGHGHPTGPDPVRRNRARLGRADAFRIGEPDSPLDLAAENAVSRDQILISQQEFLVYRTRDISQQSFSIHLPKVNQNPLRQSRRKSLSFCEFEMFDTTGCFWTGCSGCVFFFPLAGNQNAPQGKRTRRVGIVGEPACSCSLSKLAEDGADGRPADDDTSHLLTEAMGSRHPWARRCVAAATEHRSGRARCRCATPSWPGRAIS